MTFAPLRRAKASCWCAVALLAVLTAFHLLTLPTGYGWGDDFAMYIHHAKNIAYGLPFAATGYIYNPHNPGIGPAVYPPGYPVLLAPIYRLFGLDLQPMRWEIVAFLIADLALVARLFWNEVGGWITLLVVAALGLNPSIWSLRTEILSDIPFLFFCLLAFLQLRRIERSPGSTTWSSGVLLGVTCYLAYATRTVGALLIASVLVSDLAANHRLTRTSAISAGVFAVLAIVQRIAVGSADSYVDQLVLDPRHLVATVVLNLKDYVLTLAELWGTDGRNPAALALTLLSLGLAVVGFARRARQGPWVLISFPIMYGATLLLWPNFQGVRFLLPLLPIYMLLVATGLGWLLRSADPIRSVLIGAAAAVVVAGFYGNFYLHAYYGPIGGGAFDNSAQEMFAYVRQSTSRDSVLVFFKPRALALFTDRSASAYFSPARPSDLRDYFREIKAQFVVTGPLDDNWSKQYLVSDPRHFTPVWSNAQFTVFRIVDLQP